MAKSQNIVHQYFKKEFEEARILVKVDPIQYKGVEITIPKEGKMEIRNMQFDEQILDDLKADGFEVCSPLEFNLYESGLV
jgi:hypothetical protein